MSRVNLPWPLIRQAPWFPAAPIGIAGTGNKTGLRQHTTGAMFYVDPYQPGASNGRTGTEPTDPLLTIQAGVDRCTAYSGDVVLVMDNDAWTYSTQTEAPYVENVVVTTPGISIIGVSRSGALGPVWRPATAGGIACAVYALDVLVEGFCFAEAHVGAGGGTGVYAAWNGFTVWGDNVTVRNCYLGDDLDIGVQLEYAWNNWITDNVFQGAAGGTMVGIYVDPAGSGAAYNHILRNEFRSCSGGAISGQGMADSDIGENRFYNLAAQGGAPVAGTGIDNTGGGTNLVWGNWFSSVQADMAGWNVSAATDAWVGNMAMDGLVVANP